MKTIQPNVRRVAGCEGKIRFNTFSRAKATAKKSAQRHEGKYTAYPCRLCGGFHIGSHIGRPKDARKTLRLVRISAEEIFRAWARNPASRFEHE
jgi:hypothetical protein